jgi:hypothetical protein
MTAINLAPRPSNGNFRQWSSRVDRLVWSIEPVPAPAPAPAPEPRYWTAADDARAARRSRLQDAQRTLAMLDPCTDRALARALGLDLRTLRRWRAGKHVPQPRHWQQITGLHVVGLWWARS